MFGIADYPAFCAAILVFLALPGPGTFALLTSTAKGGVRGGAAATAGLIAGDQVLLWLAVAGVAALLAAHPTWFRAVQYLGAAYLAWIGLKLLFGGPGGGSPVTITAGHYARQAFLITLLNPKAIVFYMAFFPLFVDPKAHQGLATFGAMALTIAVLTFLYCATLSLIVHFAAERIRANVRITGALNKVAGTMLLAFGIKLALGK